MTAAFGRHAETVLRYVERTRSFCVHTEPYRWLVRAFAAEEINGWLGHDSE
jgi:hypothetical protein